jgi:rod shape-determining protein MreB and related proteins
MRNNTVLMPIELESRNLMLKVNRLTSEEAPPAEPTSTQAATLLVGFDWGTNKSCLQASFAGCSELFTQQIIPTVVGYANKDIVDDLLPDNRKTLFGDEALKHRLHLRLVQPMIDGVISDLAASRDFAKHLREAINTQPGTELRGVIGLPANAERAARENLRQAVAGLFDRVIMIPEPFLAALGYRDESRLGDSTYVDPVKNSLFVDIGGGTTDVCLVQGYFPTAEDQISMPFAGDKVDVLINEAIKKTYPDCSLSLLKIRELKEQYSFVGNRENQVIANVVVGGKMRKLDLTSPIGSACHELLHRVLEGVKVLIARASSDSVTELMQNIVLTGGGSRIRGLDSELQRLLTEEGYENPRVHVVGENYKEFVAKGALKAARQAKESQWQQLMS